MLNDSESQVFGVEKRFHEDGAPKKDSITILTKIHIINDCEAGLSRERIRQKYNLKSVNNISRIMINKHKFLEAYEKYDLSPMRKTLKKTKHYDPGNIDPIVIKSIDDRNLRNIDSLRNKFRMRSRLNKNILESRNEKIVNMSVSASNYHDDNEMEEIVVDSGGDEPSNTEFDSIYENTMSTHHNDFGHVGFSNEKSRPMKKDTIRSANEVFLSRFKSSPITEDSSQDHVLFPCTNRHETYHKRTRTDWSLDQKREIILFYEANQHLTQQQIADHFSKVFEKRIGRSTINDVLKLKYKLFSPEFCTKNEGKRLTEGKHPHLEKCLINWASELNKQGVSITDKMIKTAAKQFGDLIGIKSSFKYSNGWLHKFKERNRIIINNENKFTNDETIFFPAIESNSKNDCEFRGISSSVLDSSTGKNIEAEAMVTPSEFSESIKKIELFLKQSDFLFDEDDIQLFARFKSRLELIQ